MLIALYHLSGVEIEGTVKELQELSRQLKDCSQVCELTLATPAECDERGLRYLSRIALTVSSGPLAISVSDRTLFIAGEKGKLYLLSQNVDWLFDAKNRENPVGPRGHVHVEYYPGHFFLSKDALPLIFECQD